MSIRLVQVTWAHATSADSHVKSLWHVACIFACRATEEYFGGCMAKIIEFYIPQSFRKVSKWLPPNERGKVLEFPMAVRQSA
jgi:hypothetical protein